MQLRPLLKHPVLVPVRQQLARADEAIEIRSDGEAVAVKHAGRALLELLGVDTHLRCERDLRIGCLDEGAVQAARLPDRGSERAIGVLLAGVQPQTSCHVRPLQRAAAQRQERDQPLDAEGKLQLAVACLGYEAAE